MLVSARLTQDLSRSVNIIELRTIENTEVKNAIR